LSDFERSDPKKKFVKFEINFEEFLRVAHPSSKQGTERFSIRFLKNFERSDPKKKFVGTSNNYFSNGELNELSELICCH